MKFLFGWQINFEVFSKVILLFWVSATRHAQSTQNKFAYLCNISIKAWRMKLSFCLQINTKVFYKSSKVFYHSGCTEPDRSKVTKTTSLQYLCNISRKTRRMKLIFCLLTKGFEGFFQIDTIILGACGQARQMVKHSQSSQNIKFAIPLQYP